MTNHPKRKSKDQYPRSLVRSWLEARQKIPGNTKTAVLRDLNEKLGTDYQPNRLYEWLTLEHEPSREARALMLQECIADVLFRHGIDPKKLTDAQLRSIAEQLG